ncbi:NET1-associated nuclear protein 1 [Coemansia sp. RSA 989]|nr:NET1-associated nuclear protein 1 [Coemansia sp. RSA 1086]KAJ1748689.1 NET1-associated nuclear protein 1 [Coemansia sp. RSA 1821]KAJ1865725.1 NET1-associated nuclear protein 1 [Coemansia sp. RSA 989]
MGAKAIVPATVRSDKHKDSKKSKSKKAKSRPAQLLIDSRADIADSLMTPIVEATISAQDTSIYRAIELKLVSGGLLTNDPIVFSNDSSLFYLAKDNAVAVYNVQNGEMVQNFSALRDSEGLDRAAIKSIVADSQSQHGVYTFSADHKARLWNADSGEQLGSWDLEASPTFVAADPLNPARFFCALRRRRQRNGQIVYRYTVCRIELNADGTVQRKDLFKANSLLGLAVRSDGQWIAAFSKFRVHVVQIRADERVVRHAWGMTERVSAIAFHPTEPVLAVGDWRGRIVFWFCVDELEEDSEDREIVRRTHHWHAHRVNAIAFAGNGLMLSGGEEGVLVMWQLLTETRDYLPRLGSDITGIAVSPDQMSYAITLRDNTVRIVSSVDRSLVSLLQGLKFAERGVALTQGLKLAENHGIEQMRRARALDADPFTTGLVVHPVTHALVLNGEPGRLQVFSPLSDRHLSSIEVAAYTRVSGTSATNVSRPHVDLVQYSSDGAWMATVDSRRADASQGLMNVTSSYLKFWRRDPGDQTYKLASRIDNPHTGGVSSIAFQPVLRKGRESLICVSAGNDRTFRVWELQHTASSDMWSCRSSAQYRGLQPTSAAFSADGSTLAVAFGGAVTLWDASTCAAPVGVLVASASTPELKGVSFIGASSYLAAWSDERLDVWNMLTGSVWWTLAMPIQDVFVHPRAELLAIAAYQIPESSTASVMVLSPASPNPLMALHHPGGVEAVALIPSAKSGKSGRSHPDTEQGQPKPDPLDSNLLVALTPSGLLSVYGAESDTPSFTSTDFKKAPGSNTLGQPMESSAFASIFGSQPEQQQQPEKVELLANAQVRSAMRLVRTAVQSSYVNAPYHVLPPVPSLFNQFATAQLVPVATTDEAPVPDTDKMDIDSDTEMIDDQADLKEQATDPWSNAEFLASMRRGFST